MVCFEGFFLTSSNGIVYVEYSYRSAILVFPQQLQNLELLSDTPEKFYLPSTKAAEIIHRVPVK